MAEHPNSLFEVLTTFRMNVVKKTSSALEIQVREAVEIARAPAASILNLKEEYNRCWPSCPAAGYSRWSP